MRYVLDCVRQVARPIARFFNRRRTGSALAAVVAVAVVGVPVVVAALGSRIR